MSTLVVLEYWYIIDYTVNDVIEYDFENIIVLADNDILNSKVQTHAKKVPTMHPSFMCFTRQHAYF